MIRFNCLFSAALFVTMSTLFAADPSPADAFLPLKQAGVVSEAQQTWAKIVANDQAIRKTFDRFSKAKSIDGKDLGKLYVAVEQFRRYRRELEECGEPSSVDFRYRESQYGKFLTNSATRFWASAQSMPQRQRVVVSLQRDLAQRVKRIEKIGQTLASDPAAAEAALDAYVDDVFLEGGILAPKEKDIAYQGLSPTDSQVRSAASQVRRNKAAGEMGAQMQQLRGAYDQLIASIRQQAAALGTSESQGGPSVLEAAIGKWKAVHIGFVKFCAIEQMSSRKAADGASQELAEATILAMKELVAADAQLGTSQEAAAKYLRYIELIADVHGRLHDESLVAHFDQPLEELAARAGMSQVVASYAAATDDMLEWTRRAADARGEALQKSYPAVESLSRAKLPSTQQQFGMYSPKNADVPVLLKAVPELVGEIDAAMTGAEVSASHVVGLDGGKIFMGQLREGFYTRVPIQPAEVASAAVETLRGDLLLSSGGRPLTVGAAAAIQTAVGGNYERAGGKIQKFAVEAALSRYADLPSIASSLVPIGFSLPRPAEGSPLSALALRVELEPAWLQHRHFVVMLK